MIFGDRVTRKHVLRAPTSLEDVERFCDERGWRLVAGMEEDQEAGNEFERIWATETTLTFHFGIDYVARVPYVCLFGRDMDAVDSYEESFVSALHPLTPDELIAAVDAQSAPAERGRAVLRAALGATMAFDQRVFDRVQAEMADADPMQRQIGILAASYPPWPEFRPLLRRLASEDPDEDVRQLAQSTLGAFDRAGVPDS